MPVVKGHEGVKIVSHAELAKIVAKNINELCHMKMSPKKTIALLCNVSPSLVTKWTSKTPILPPADALLVMADYFGVDVVWLLQEHTSYELPDYTKTYSGAFMALVSLLDKGIIETDFVSDPIVSYLLGRYLSLKEANIVQADFDAWLERIVKEFDIPIGEYHNDVALQTDILRNESGIAAVDEDMKQRNLAKALSDEEVVERAYQRVYGTDEDK